MNIILLVTCLVIRPLIANLAYGAKINKLLVTRSVMSVIILDTWLRISGGPYFVSHPIMKSIFGGKMSNS